MGGAGSRITEPADTGEAIMSAALILDSLQAGLDLFKGPAAVAAGPLPCRAGLKAACEKVRVDVSKGESWFASWPSQCVHATSPVAHHHEAFF